MKLYYLSNYQGMTVNYCGICITYVTKHNLTQMAIMYCGILTLQKAKGQLAILIVSEMVRIVALGLLVIVLPMN